MELHQQWMPTPHFTEKNIFANASATFQPFKYIWNNGKIILLSVCIYVDAEYTTIYNIIHVYKLHLMVFASFCSAISLVPFIFVLYTHNFSQPKFIYSSTFQFGEKNPWAWELRDNHVNFINHLPMYTSYTYCIQEYTSKSIRQTERCEMIFTDYYGLNMLNTYFTLTPYINYIQNIFIYCWS